jgi:hypothetical protein
MRIRRLSWVVFVLSWMLAGLPPAASGPVAVKRIAFLVDSWYRWSHADVIGTRFLEGYRVGEKTFSSPLTVSSVYTDLPRSTDVTRNLAGRYGFRVASSIADALLEDSHSSRPRLAVDGVLIATREDLPGSGQTQSPVRRLQVMREVIRIMDQTGARVPVFIDKLLAGTWPDSQAIVAEAGNRGIPLMAGSVLPFLPLDRPLRTSGIQVAVVIASTPYWAFAFHAADLLQGFMEQRGPRETGVSEIREVGPGYWSLPDRERWGGRVFDALLASAKTRRSVPPGPETVVLLIQYADGTRAVLGLIPRAFDDHEFLLGAQYSDGSTGLSGLVLQSEPFDHFGYLVHALVELYTTGRAPVPVERSLLTTGIVQFGLQARQAGSPVATPTLALSYQRTRP